MCKGEKTQYELDICSIFGEAIASVFIKVVIILCLGKTGN